MFAGRTPSARDRICTDDHAARRVRMSVQRLHEVDVLASSDLMLRHAIDAGGRSARLAMTVLEYAERLGSQLPEFRSDIPGHIRPRFRSDAGVAFLPHLLRQFLDEPVPVFGRAEAMTAH